MGCVFFKACCSFEACWPDDPDHIRERIIASHPAKRIEDCDDAECWVCAIRDCPNREAFHYHHDGCPACYVAEKKNRAD